MSGSVSNTVSQCLLLFPANCGTISCRCSRKLQKQRGERQRRAQCRGVRSVCLSHCVSYLQMGDDVPVHTSRRQTRTTVSSATPTWGADTCTGESRHGAGEQYWVSQHRYIVLTQWDKPLRKRRIQDQEMVKLCAIEWVVAHEGQWGVCGIFSRICSNLIIVSQTQQPCFYWVIWWNGYGWLWCACNSFSLPAHVRLPPVCLVPFQDPPLDAMAQFGGRTSAILSFWEL